MRQSISTARLMHSCFAARAVEGLIHAVDDVLETLGPNECLNSFKSCGYNSVKCWMLKPAPQVPDEPALTGRCPFRFEFARGYKGAGCVPWETLENPDKSRRTTTKSYFLSKGTMHDRLRTDPLPVRRPSRSAFHGFPGGTLRVRRAGRAETRGPYRNLESEGPQPTGRGH